RASTAGLRPRIRAAASNSFSGGVVLGLLGWGRAPVTVALGASSCGSSRLFGPNRVNMGAMPVTFPVGRLMLDTRPAPIGSLPLRKTIGICLSCSLCCKRRRKKVSGDSCYSIFYQLGRQSRQSIGMTIRRAVFDRHVLGVDEAGLAQTLPKGIHQRQRLWRPLVQESYHRERLLRPRLERPRGCAAESQDELAACHSITSSARAMS